MPANRPRNIFLVFFFLIVQQFIAQQVRVEAVLDSSRMRIGEQVNVDLYVTYDASLKDIRIEWPKIGDTLTSKVEVVAISSIDTTLPNKSNSTRIFQHQQITISVYDSGYFAIPPFKFVFNNDTVNTAYTNPLFLEVHTVPTDTSATKIKDIKPPFEEKFNWKWYLPYLYWALAILALIIIIFLVMRYYANKRKQNIVVPEKPKIPAHITALAALERIKSEQIWKEGKVKEYYSDITDTIRIYIEGRFNVHALESTSDEIMTAFRSLVIDKESKEKLQQLLTLSDLVKFAKMFPVEAENNFTLQNAFDFVNGTKREEVVELAQTEAVNSPASHVSIASPSMTVQETQSKYAPSSGVPSQPIPEAKKEAIKETVIQPVKKSKIGKKIFIAGVTVITLAIAFFVVYKFTGKETVESQLETISETMNAKCPITIDRQTRLDQTSVLPGRVIQYHYTLVNVASRQVDPDAMKKQMEPALIDNVKTDPQMKFLRDKNVTLQYLYRDKNGVLLMTITITPDHYKKSA